jgi:hypothetical protein
MTCRAAACIACAFKGRLPEIELDRSTLLQTRVERLYHNIGFLRSVGDFQKIICWHSGYNLVSSEICASGKCSAVHVHLLL